MVKQGDQVVGVSGQSIEEICFRTVRCKLATVLNDSIHPVVVDRCYIALFSALVHSSRALTTLACDSA